MVLPIPNLKASKIDAYYFTQLSNLYEQQFSESESSYDEIKQNWNELRESLIYEPEFGLYNILTTPLRLRGL